MKLPVKTGPSRKDPVNGGEYRVLMDSAGAWLADVRSEHAEQIVTALNASPPEAPREGWKLVPVEPTLEMEDACIDLTLQHARALHSSSIDWAAGYRAMLAAAPSRSPQPCPYRNDDGHVAQRCPNCSTDIEEKHGR